MVFTSIMQVEECCQYNIKNIKLTDEKEDCPAALKDDIKAIIKSKGFIKYDIKINKLPVTGGNYLADLYEIDVTGTTNEGNKEIHLFVKQLAMDAGNLNSILDIPGVYKIEKFVYKELSQIFNELQEDAKVPMKERFKMVKSYDSNPGAIIMDNLCKEGYKLYSRTDVVTFDYADLAIKNLAKFHALSHVMERNKPDFFASKIKTLKYPVHFAEDFVTFQKSIFSLAMSYLDDNTRNRVEDTAASKLCKYRQYLEKPELHCLCHGDYRVMNIMIRDLDGKLTDMMALDYQIINYGNPLIDLIYFIFSATDKEFRKLHLAYLKDTYYETQKDFLKYFDIDIDEILPRKTFERIFEESLDYGLIIMMAVVPLMYADEEDVPDLANTSMDNLNFKVHNIYKDLLKGVIEEFLEWGLL